MIKLRAIRLREVGCFSDGVALERLGDGLNVLSGRNELGKSTVLEALRIAFKYPYNTSDKRVVRLQPYRGGAPKIEIDFDTGEGRWRLCKTYLAGKSASLLNLDTHVVLRDKDV